MSDLAPEELVSKTIVVAAKAPGVRVDREAYLRSALKRHCSEAQVALALADGPRAAGVSSQVLDDAAMAAIRMETTKVTAISAVAGIPGGLAMLGTVPADTAQFFGHMIRIAQKLAYLYDWPDLFDEEEDSDDATKNVLILFLGVMLGANMATGAVTKLSTMMAAQAARKLPQQALTKGVIYPIVKKVAMQLGAKMTKSIFAGGVAKAIPLVGGALSGGLTLATFLPMALKLKKHLAGLTAAEQHLDPTV